MILGRDQPPSSAWVPVSIDDYFKGDKQVLSYSYSTLDQLEDFARYPETATFDDSMRSNKLGWRLMAIMGKDGGPTLRSCSKPHNHCAHVRAPRHGGGDIQQACATLRQRFPPTSEESPKPCARRPWPPTLWAGADWIGSWSAEAAVHFMGKSAPFKTRAKTHCLPCESSRSAGRGIPVAAWARPCGRGPHA
jgi:hypothetical protein